MPRLFGVDTARGMALLGMFAAHTIGIGTEEFYDGRSSILFATVAGVSLGLLTGAADPPPAGARGIPRVVVLVRACVLIVLGVLLTAVVRPPIAVILDFYGFGFVLLLGVLFSSRALLLFLAGVVALIGPPIVTAMTAGRSLEDVPAPVQVFANWLFFGPYPVAVWLAFLLIGLVLARSDLHRRRTALGALIGGVVAALVGYRSALVIPGTDISAHSGTTAEMVGSGGVAVAIVGALSLLDSASGGGVPVARVLRTVLGPFAAAGAMALTLYVAQAIVLAVVQQTDPNPQRWQVPAWLFLVLAGGALVIAPVWQRFVGKGPLERGLGVLTRFVVRAPRRPGVAP